MNKTTWLLLRVLLYHVRTLYVRNYLMRESDSDFLRTNPGIQWDLNLKQFESYAGAIEEKAKLAGVPVVVTFLPNRAQAAMVCMGTWPEGFDPYKIDNEVRTITGKSPGIYLDIVPDFRDIPYAEGNYYPVDGHPDARGSRSHHTHAGRRIYAEPDPGIPTARG